MVRVTVNHDLCLGDGTCAEVLPQVFTVGEDLLAYVILDPIDKSMLERVEEARDRCPTGAVEVHRAGDHLPRFLRESIQVLGRDPGGYGKPDRSS